MPEMKKFYLNTYGNQADCHKGILVNIDMLRDMAANNEKISLIKVLRVVSGFGLKEAKDGVENNCVDGRDVEKQVWGVCNPDKTEAYFRQFLGPFPTEAELKAEKEVKTGKTMLEGCALAYAHWKILGHSNSFEAARCVIDRYENKF